MPGLDSDGPPTSLTRIHVRLHETLWALGYDVEDEVAVGRYSLDCYVREWHLGFEADGPHHHRRYQRKHDVTRDAWILETAGIPILRVPDTQLKAASDPSLVEEIEAFVREHADTAAVRRLLAEASLGGV